MTRQQFHTADVLALEIEDDWPGLPNIMPNPSGEFGVWGWDLDSLQNLSTVAGPAYRFDTASGFQVAQTDRLYVDNAGGNNYVRARVTRTGGTAGFSCRFVLLRADDSFIANGPDAGPQTVNGDLDVPAVQLTADTAYVRLFFVIDTPGAYADFNAVCVVNGTAAEVAAPLTVEPGWVDLLSPATSIRISRAGLDLGTLAAVIRDSTLDPAQSSLIRKGKPLRARALNSDTAEFERIFTGRVLNADVSYDLRHPDPTRRARIELTAVDPASLLANTPRPDGVQTIDELAYVLDRIAVPWSINGSSSGWSLSATVVARNDKASALDQIALTRDTALGYAWVSRDGVLTAWDAAQIPAVSLATLTEDDYSDLQLGFNTEDLINDVTVLVRTIDASGDTVETEMGPYADELSVREWGRYHQDFTVQESGWAAADAAAYAAAILAANATPVVRIKSVTLPVVDATADLAGDGPAFLDLYDLVTVENTDAGLSDSSRITRVEHTITPHKWLVAVEFAAVGAVAQPTVTPRPQDSADMLVISEEFTADSGNLAPGAESGNVNVPHSLGVMPSVVAGHLEDGAWSDHVGWRVTSRQSTQMVFTFRNNGPNNARAVLRYRLIYTRAGLT